MTADEDSIAAAQARVAALHVLLRSRQRSPVQLVETHVSWVLLAETHACKLKKPVRLPFRSAHRGPRALPIDPCQAPSIAGRARSDHHSRERQFNRRRAHHG